MFRFLCLLITGMMFTLGVLSYWFGVSDPVVGILGCTSQVIASFTLIFSTIIGEWILYAGEF